MEKDYVNYILSGEPGIPDEELPTPDETDVGKRLAEPIKEKAADKLGNVRKLYDQGMNDCQIAKEVGVSSNTIMNWRRKENLPPNYNAKAPKKTTIKPTVNKEFDEMFTKEKSKQTDRLDILKSIGSTEQQIKDPMEELTKLNYDLIHEQYYKIAKETFEILKKIWESFPQPEKIEILK